MTTSHAVDIGGGAAAASRCILRHGETFQKCGCGVLTRWTFEAFEWFGKDEISLEPECWEMPLCRKCIMDSIRGC